MLKTLPVKLSDDERRMKGSQLAQKIQEGDEIASALAGAKSKYKVEAERVAKEITELARSLREGTEYRDVECEERFDFTAGRVSTVRLDTYETVETRPMKSEERQNKLFEEEQAMSDHAEPEAQAELPLADPEADNKAIARGFESAADMDVYLELVPRSEINDEKLLKWMEAGGNREDLVNTFTEQLAGHHAARIRGFRDDEESGVYFDMVPASDENAKKLEGWVDANGTKAELLALFPELQAAVDEYNKTQETVAAEFEPLTVADEPIEESAFTSMACPLCLKENGPDGVVGLLVVCSPEGEEIRRIPEDTDPESIAPETTVRCAGHGTKPWGEWLVITEACKSEAPKNGRKRRASVTQFPSEARGEATA